jgi:hypothetical protein
MGAAIIQLGAGCDSHDGDHRLVCSLAGVVIVSKSHFPTLSVPAGPSIS